MVNRYRDADEPLKAIVTMTKRLSAKPQITTEAMIQSSRAAATAMATSSPGGSNAHHMRHAVRKDIAAEATGSDFFAKPFQRNAFLYVFCGELHSSWWHLPW